MVRYTAVQYRDQKPRVNPHLTRQTQQRGLFTGSTLLRDAEGWPTGDREACGTLLVGTRNTKHRRAECVRIIGIITSKLVHRTHRRRYKID